ncbi:HlyD family efflux transporter periplasmic adaptor subunit [Ramlibacter tataouinensis]|nr:HlyD family efflux transporter periplasmic adaptor subunit [Ramlibacter tataouinensis]
MAIATAGSPRLPTLREELRLLPAAANRDGSPAWTVQDPLTNRFFRIGWLDFEVLLRWSLGSARDIADSVNEETTLSIDEDDVHELAGFLEQNSLVRADTAQAVDRLRDRAARMQTSPLQWLLHHYLFFRIPLVRPQVWLAGLLPYVDWVFSRTTAWALAALTLTGLVLAGRQWETFAGTVVEQLTWSGMLGYTVALVFAKALHEMGHALTATRYGVRVAHMGVALLVLFPMLYTDTGESWKLHRSRQRLAIASAGMVTELALAGLATLAWSLAPDGAVRNALFFLATTSWVLTLLVNASPFMRFDGYFILSDLLDLPNLHERSGALARTWMRRTLLGFDEPWPERLPGRGNAMLIAFALVTWAYRLTVFLGIALLVYHFAFKLLGLFLMAVELVWFIGRPVWAELCVWRERKGEIRRSRKRWAGALLAALLLVVLLPWQTGVRASGWVHAERQQVIHSPLAARLAVVPQEGAVTQGQPLFALQSPELALSAQRALSLADARARELIGLSGFADGEERRQQLQHQQDRYLAEASLFQGEQQRLQLVAPFAGVLTDLDPQLAGGVWVQPRQPLAILVDPSRWTVEAFVAEEDMARVRVGDAARVYLQTRSREALVGRVVEVDATRTTMLPHAMLDANKGGSIVVVPREGSAAAAGSASAAEHAPRDALYRVRIALDGRPASLRMALSEVVITGQAHAWLPGLLERLAVVLVRESGF